jgi:hypothetical protein
MTGIKVGDTFYSKEADSYDYRKTRKPEARYRRVYVIGETARSWLVAGYEHAHPRLATKIPKSDPFRLKPNAHTPRIYTEAQIKEDIWVDENRSRIGTRVQYANYHQLRQIAEIIGYHEDRRANA